MSEGYQIEVDSYRGPDWDSIIENFEDSNIYQTWSYGVAVSEGQMPSTIVLKRNGKVVSACLLRIARTGFLHSGFAYARWGPLWKRSGVDVQENIQNIRKIYKILADEYSGKRNLILKVLPLLYEDDELVDEVTKTLKEQAYVRDQTFEDRTILVNLSKETDVIRTNLHQSWRRNLKKAESIGIEVVAGTDEEYLYIFRKLYSEMLRRKKYKPSVELNDYIKMQKTIKSKMLTFIAYHGDSPCSGGVVSLINNTAIYLFGATDDRAITLNASYLVHWSVIERLKEMGASWYDLNGANPERNHDMYQFKSGLGGKERREVSFIGRFDKYKKTVGNRILIKAFEIKKKYQ